MLKEGLTIREATEFWVREFNAIPRNMLAKVMQADIDDWTEVTFPSCGDRVYLDSGETGYISNIADYGGETLYEIDIDNENSVVLVSQDKFEVVGFNDFLPMWGTMWSFGNQIDDGWLESGGGIKIMSECGFRVYKSGEFGYWFGIDGAGYDFYESHWIPLYKKRGLKWHDERTVSENE